MSSPKKTVLITGCSAGGIGFALAQEFQSRGLHVFATARDPSKMSALQDEPDMTLLALDVSSPPSIAAAVAAVKAHTGGTLDYLVNNAGALYVTPVLDGDVARAKALFDVNLWGVVSLTQAFAPLVVEAKGCVANISSIAGIMYAPYYGFYAASKSALQTLGETLRLELQPFGVRVITVVSGAVESKVFNNGVPLRLPAGSLYRPAEKEIAARAAGADIEKNHSTLEEYSRALVSDFLGGKDGKVYRGCMSTLVRVLAAWSPAWLFEWFSWRGTGLDKVGKPKQL
ncbi:short-chain dehydrogenase reductase family [Diplodia corticola]|uniref:Short-chain dehydrogenase reductase family n=1 Tax=Diplodia corticola TaxID=236234 RepID=A0A1J9QX91_9PEZI|nr:short-chain dehydrogenase reductase family [Diplodia corticola]OJD32602.1 short-chain dehydrogenase reductase family [Diplodia corticola]